MKLKFIIFVLVVLVVVFIVKPSYQNNDDSFFESPSVTATLAQKVISIVPFTSQAPFGDWKDPRQQDGCEEASALMAMRWVTGQNLNPREALTEILAISQYQEKNFGNYHDSNARDTVERIFKGYYGFTGAIAKSNISIQDIKEEINKDNLVIIPVNGQKLGNPNFTAPGPERHMLVVLSYDSQNDQFVTNDPGTRKGKNYRYKSSVIQNALLDYPTGNHVPITSQSTAMIVVSR